MEYFINLDRPTSTAEKRYEYQLSGYIAYNIRNNGYTPNTFTGCYWGDYIEGVDYNQWIYITYRNYIYHGIVYHMVVIVGLVRILRNTTIMGEYRLIIVWLSMLVT